MKGNLSSSMVILVILALVSGANRARSCGQTQGEIFPLPSMGGADFLVNGINAAGQLTGFSYTEGDLEQHAFLFSGNDLADLGTLSGSSSVGTAINASGQIAGNSSAPDDFGFGIHAVLYDGNDLLDLGTLGGFLSFAAAINDSGCVVGSSLLDDYFSWNAFLYEKGSMTSLGTLGGDYSAAVAINQSGTVAGEATTFNGETHAFLYANGVMMDLGTLGGDYSTSYGLNDANLVVGRSSLANGQVHAFAYAHGGMIDLGTLGGASSIAYAINDANQIIGRSYTDDGQIHAFLYSDGEMKDLGTLGGSFSDPHAINNLGQVVGTSHDGNGQARAFLYQGGVMTDLNTLLPANSGWVLEAAQFINDAGRIVGFGSYSGHFAWFVLDLGAGPNRPPIAVAGSEQRVVGCQSQATLDGSQSSDPDGDPLSFEWSEGELVLGREPILVATFDPGAHDLSLKVTDSCGASSQANIVVNVTDSIPPAVIGPATLTAAADADCQAALPDILSAVVAGDNCTAAPALRLSQNPPAGTPVGLGEHLITVTATDASGNTATCPILFNVADATPPRILSATADPAILSPPNHNMVPVTVEVVASDNCDSAPANRITAVLCDESVAAGEIEVTGDLTLKLAASKNSTGSERVYTIIVQSSDSSGNNSSTSIAVTVSKSNASNAGNGKKK